MSRSEQRKMLILLILALVCIYGFSDMKLIFYDVIREALQLTDFEMGRVWSTFGVAAMGSYIVGGYISDRFSKIRIIATALTGSGILHFLMGISTGRSLVVLMSISAGMGLCAVLLFFPASSKILTTMSGESTGRILGYYYGFAGAITSLVNIVVTIIYARINNALLLFRGMMFLFSFTSFVTAIVLLIVFGKWEEQSETQDNFNIKHLPDIIKRKEIWIISLIIFSNYLICCFMSYFSPYFSEEFGMNVTSGLMVGTVRMGVFCFLSGIIWGTLRDRINSGIKVIGISFLVLIVIIGLTILNHYSVHNLLIAVLLCFAITLIVLGNKSIALVTLKEIDVAPGILGTVIGLVSFIGYSPDAIFYPVAGKIIETCGSRAYVYLFAIAGVFALIGLAATRSISIINKSTYVSED